MAVRAVGPLSPWPRVYHPLRMRRAPASTPPPAERLAFLEGMRGVLALYVAVGHVFTMVDPSITTGARSTAPAWIRTVAGPFLYGHVAVALFIVISGFSLQLGLLQGGGSGQVRTTGGFFRRRALRILPAYYAALAVSIVVAANITSRFPYPPFSTYLPVDAATVGSHLLLIQNLSRDWMYKINGVLWTIAIEVQLYLFFPWLVRFQALRGRGALLFVGGMVGLGLNVLFPTSFRLWFAFLFAVGIAAAHLVYRPPARGRIEGWIARLGWLGLFLGFFAIGTTRDHAASDVPFGIALACLCALGTVGGGGWAIRLLGAKPITILGGFSYSLYLIHHPVEQVVYALRPSWVDGPGPLFAWLTFVGLPCMVAAGWAFSIVFERPFLRRRISRFPRSQRVVPGSLPLPGKPRA